jgi:hypothetical protein
VPSQTSLGEVRHLKWFWLRLAYATKNCIRHNQRLWHLPGAHVDGDDVIHFLNVLFAHGSPAETTDRMGGFFTTDTIHDVLLIFPSKMSYELIKASYSNQG